MHKSLNYTAHFREMQSTLENYHRVKGIILAELMKNVMSLSTSTFAARPSQPSPDLQGWVSCRKWKYKYSVCSFKLCWHPQLTAVVSLVCSVCPTQRFLQRARGPKWSTATAKLGWAHTYKKTQRLMPSHGLPRPSNSWNLVRDLPLKEPT